jgi:hypothetical protein
MSKLPLVDGVLRKYHPLYGAWKSMRGRCMNKSHPRYSDWGGRGIKICQRWHDFAMFVKDMGERPDGHSLDRIDNNGDYCPENCKWSSPSEQNKNQRVRKDSVLGIKGVSKKASGYQARIYVDSKSIHLGVYEKLEDAVRAVELKTNFQKLRNNNTTGVKGVSKGSNGYYVAYVYLNGKTHYIGSSKDFFDAVCMRKSEERRLGFSLTHGILKNEAN